MENKKQLWSRLRDGDWSLWPLVMLFFLSCVAVHCARKRDAAK